MHLLGVLWMFLSLKSLFLCERLYLTKDIVCGETNVDRKCCDCRDNCVSKSTCCYDKLFPPKETPTDDQLLQVDDSYRVLQCKEIIPFANMSTYESGRAWMVASCLPGTSNDLQTECLSENTQGLFDGLPVLGADGYLYKNRACAKCNDLSSVENVKLKLDCHQRLDANNSNIFTKFSFCILNMDQTEKFDCLKSKKDSVCRSSNVYWNVCNSFKTKRRRPNESCIQCLPFVEGSPVLGERSCRVATKNPFEYEITKPKTTTTTLSHRFVITATTSSRSNNTTPKLSIPIFPPIQPGPLPPTTPMVHEPFRWSLTISFSQSPGETSSPFFTINTDCPIGRRYSLFKSQCVEIICKSDEILEGSKCVKDEVNNEEIPQNESKTLIPRFDTCFKNDALLIIHIQNTTDIASETITKINDRFPKLDFDFENATSGHNYIIKSRLPTNNISDIIQNATDALQNSSVKYTAVISSHPFHQKTQIHGFDISRDFGFNKLCFRPQVINRTIDLLNNSKNTTEFCGFNQTFTSNSTESVSWLEIYNGTMTMKLSICRKFYLQPSLCSSLKKIENYTLNINKSITKASKTYEPSQYLPIGDGVIVCGDAKTALRWKEKLEKAERYISIVCSFVSILCYLALIFTYLAFEKLRTIPSWNTSALCMSLLFADVIYLVVVLFTHGTTGCQVLAVLLHWSVLVAQMWVLLISIDLAARFGKLMRPTKRNLFPVYCVVSIAIPSSIVIITTLLQFVRRQPIGYGERGVCWIYGFHARLFSYVIIVAVIYVVSFALLSYVIYHVYQVERSSQMNLTQRSQHVNILKIGLKLAIVLGVVEILGFIQITKSNLSQTEEVVNSLFSFLYSLCRSCKGLLLFAVYFKASFVQEYRRAFEERFATKESITSPTTSRTYTTAF